METKELLPYQQRVVTERDELKVKMDALLALLQKGKPEDTSDKAWELMKEQYDAMNWYYTVLVSCIELF